MTYLVRTLPRSEAVTARVRAKQEFTDALTEFDRSHLVSDAALTQWWQGKGPGPALGEPESIYLDKESR